MGYNWEGHNGLVPMTKLHIRFNQPRLGSRTGYIVDEHGCQQNTEAVCSVPVPWHDWFIDWLENQEFDYPTELVYCPMRTAVTA